MNVTNSYANVCYLPDWSGVKTYEEWESQLYLKIHIIGTWMMHSPILEVGTYFCITRWPIYSSIIFYTNLIEFPCKHIIHCLH